MIHAARCCRFMTHSVPKEPALLLCVCVGVRKFGTELLSLPSCPAWKAATSWGWLTQRPVSRCSALLQDACRIRIITAFSILITHHQRNSFFVVFFFLPLADYYALLLIYSNVIKEYLICLLTRILLSNFCLLLISRKVWHFLLLQRNKAEHDDADGLWVRLLFTEITSLFSPPVQQRLPETFYQGTMITFPAGSVCAQRYAQLPRAAKPVRPKNIWAPFLWCCHFQLRQCMC